MLLSSIIPQKTCVCPVDENYFGKQARESIGNLNIYSLFSPSECQARHLIFTFCLRRAAQTAGKNNCMFDLSKSTGSGIVWFRHQNVRRATQSFLSVWGALPKQWVKPLYVRSFEIYNPGQNYVGQACRMHCLDEWSVFHMETNVLWAKFYLPPSPHAMLFVRKGLPKSRPTLHQGGRRERANIAGNREKGTVSHTFSPGLSESRTFTTNAHSSKCMEYTVSKFVWVKFVHVVHTSLASRLWKNSFVAI